MTKLTPVVKTLLIINISAHVFFMLMDTDNKALDLLKLYHFGSEKFQPWQLLTNTFLHGNFRHLLFNMLPILFFGPLIEQLLGGKKFLILYLVSGIGASIFYELIFYFDNIYVIDAALNDLTAVSAKNAFDWLDVSLTESGRENMDRWYRGEMDFSGQVSNELSGIRSALLNFRPLVGASGSVFAILTAAALYFPNMMVFLLFPPMPVRMKYLVIFYGAMEFFSGIHRIPGDNIAHFAHLGGMLFAFLLYYTWRKTGNNARRV